MWSNCFSRRSPARKLSLSVVFPTLQEPALQTTCLVASSNQGLSPSACACRQQITSRRVEDWVSRTTTPDPAHKPRRSSAFEDGLHVGLGKHSGLDEVGVADPESVHGRLQSHSYDLLLTEIPFAL